MKKSNKKNLVVIIPLVILTLLLLPIVYAESIEIENCGLSEDIGFSLESCEYELMLKTESTQPTIARPNYEIQPFFGPDEFISIWDVDNSLTISLPLVENGEYNFTVEGQNLVTNKTIINYTDNEISFVSSNISQISITGTLQGWSFEDSSDAPRLLEVKNWGNLSLGETHAQFNGTSNLLITANDTPNLSNTTSFAYIFRNSDVSVFNSSNDWNTSTIQNLTLAFDDSNFNSPINNWDVSNVVDFSVLFYRTNFNQDISLWNTSKAKDMSFMFWGAQEFDQDITNWDVSNVTDMTAMFYNARKFNQDISDWNVSNVQFFNFMFYRAFDFNQPIGSWNTQSALNMRAMFYDKNFNRDISGWNTSKVTSMSIMFYDTNFNQPIGSWDVGKVETMERMFYLSDFNQNLSAWNTSSLQNTEYMFTGSPYNNGGDAGINHWNVQNLNNGLGMFAVTDFNQPIGSWDVQSLQEGRGFFANSEFNQNISAWNVSQLTSAGFFFQNAPFEYDINRWDVSSVDDFDGFFWGAENFNQPLNDWDVSSTTSAEGMFFGASSFDQDISMWNVSNVESFDGSTSMFLENSNFSTMNYDKLLRSWRNLNLQTDITFGAPNSTFCIGESAKQDIVDDFSWSFNDAGKAEDCGAPFVSVWNTSLSGSSGNNEILLPLEDTGTYNFTVVSKNLTEEYIEIDNYQDNLLTFDTEGIQEIYIYGDINGWRFNDDGDASKIIEIKQWGNISFGNNGGFFRGTSNLRNITAIDSPYLSGITNMNNAFRDSGLVNANLSHWNMDSVTNMQFMFQDTFGFDGDISGWDVSNVTDMWGMFADSSFDGDISGWDVSSVNNMRSLFFGSSFDGDISGWDVSSVNNMRTLFYDSSFDGDVSSWDVSSVTDMEYMFRGTPFDGDVSGWDVSNVEDMTGMWLFSDFNGDLSQWDVSSVTDMSIMFYGASFNGNISAWDVSSVNDMSSVFAGAEKFNGNISSWNVSNVNTMNRMFSGAISFNGDISGWDVSNVEDFGLMFLNAEKFNQDIGKWNTSNVVDMSSFLANAKSFDQDIGSWDVSNVNSYGGQFGGFLQDVNLSMSNYDSLLVGWSELELQSGLSFDAGNSKFGPVGEVARENIISDFGWSFVDGGLVNVTPKTSKFNGSTSFNDSRLDNTSIVLEVVNKGRIGWVNSLDVRLADFDSGVEIDDNKVFVNSSGLGNQFDSSAVITFYNITWKKPLVLRDGVLCGDCVIQSYENNTLEVLVPGFSTYTTIEGEEEQEEIQTSSVSRGRTGGENITLNINQLNSGVNVSVYRLQNIILNTTQPTTFFVESFGTNYVIANVEGESLRLNESNNQSINIPNNTISITYQGKNLSSYSLFFQREITEIDEAEPLFEDVQIINLGRNMVSEGEKILNISKQYRVNIRINESVNITSENQLFNVELSEGEVRSLTHNDTSNVIFEVLSINESTALLSMRLDPSTVGIEIDEVRRSYFWIYVILGTILSIVLITIYVRRRT